MSGLGVKYSPAPALGILSVLLQKALVDVSFHVYVQTEPRLRVDKLDKLLELRRVLYFVLRLAENDAEHSFPFRKAL